MGNNRLIKQQEYINKTPKGHSNQTTKEKKNNKNKSVKKIAMIQGKPPICSKMWSGKQDLLESPPSLSTTSPLQLPSTVTIVAEEEITPIMV